MPEHDGAPMDAAAAANLVARVVEEVDRSNDDDRLILLRDLLCAAWPSEAGQNQ
jgi:hypothetical protein